MKTINEEIAAIMELDNFYISIVCQASKWLDEKAQGLTGDEEGIKHTYLDRVDCARALIVANDKLQEQAQNYNKLWAHSSGLQEQLAERDRVIAFADKALQSWDGYYANSDLVYTARNQIAAITTPTEE